jgi:predicted nucleic acid-binding protein
VRAGAEIMIESGKLPVAVIRAPAPPRRTISECIALLPEDSTAVSWMLTSPGCRSSDREPSRAAATARIGLILDSSVLIKAERRGQNARQMLAAIACTAGNIDIAISVVTLIELAHGAARADTAARKAKRQSALPIHPVTITVALRVGQIDGENQAKGVRLSLCIADLLIGVTALELASLRGAGRFLFLTSPLIGSLTGGGNRFHSTAIPQLSKKRPCAATVENRSSHPM